MIARPLLDASLHPAHSGPLGLEYVEQRSADMAFYLFQSPAPRHAVRVLAERELVLPGGRAALAIIGSSHFLEVRVGASVLCEMLACEREGLGPTAVSAKVRDLAWRGHRARLGPVLYRFRIHERSLHAEAFAEETDRLSALRLDRLVYLFPTGREGEGAVTCLDWRLSGRRLAVATHHTFPEERAIVSTRTVVDLAQIGAVP